MILGMAYSSSVPPVAIISRRPRLFHEGLRSGHFRDTRTGILGAGIREALKGRCAEIKRRADKAASTGERT